MKTKRNINQLPQHAAYRVILTLLLVGGFIFTFMFWVGYESQFYSQEDIIEICTILQLDNNSKFCDIRTKSSSNDLEQALEEQYPLGEATYEELESSFEALMYYHRYSESDCSTTDSNGSCPAPNGCYTNYSCRVDLPIQRLIITFDENGIVAEYYVPSDS